MAFAVEQACPQCGAPVELEETDRLLECPFCRVQSFLYARDCFRFVLPHKTPGRVLLYAPFTRFKGAVYRVQGPEMTHRIFDITRLSAAVRGLPISLGVRCQALKLKFLKADTGGTFLPAALGVEDILSAVEKQTSGSNAGRLFHRAYIGEMISRIYLPLYAERDRLFDAITEKPVMKMSDGEDLFASAVEYPRGWKLFFLATLCPECGWNLDGDRNSCVLTCRNCHAVWEASDGRFVEMPFAVAPGRDQAAVYLPFWRFRITSTGIPIDCYADFMRITNQPRVIRTSWEDQDMYFWSPAFKIRPQIFLRVASQLTVAQKTFETRETFPRKGTHPVTLPQSEAVQGLKLILARSAYTKKQTFPLLPGMDFTVKDSTLIFLPFTDRGIDLVQQHMPLSINKNALSFGRCL